MALAFERVFDPQHSYSDTELLELASRHDLRFERDAQGRLSVAPPTGMDTGKRNSLLVLQLGLWNREHKLGELFDSSTGFRLPDGSVLSPDAAWVERSRWEALAESERRTFGPLSPDVIFEIASPSDRLHSLRKKMRVYLRNDVRLGVLLMIGARSVELYRPSGVQTFSKPDTVSLEPELPGFVLESAELLT